MKSSTVLRARRLRDRASAPGSASAAFLTSRGRCEACPLRSRVMRDWPGRFQIAKALQRPEGRIGPRPRPDLLQGMLAHDSSIFKDRLQPDPRVLWIRPLFFRHDVVMPHEV